MIDNLEDDYNSVKAELSVRDNAIQSGDTAIKLQSADNASLLDDYNDIKAEQLNLSALSAFKKNPEESAKIYSIAKAKNLPIDYVERNLDKVSRPDISSLPPAVADLMRDRQKAAIAHDDLDNLSWWESSINELGNLGETGKAGLFSLSSAGYSLLGQAAKVNEVTFPGNVIGPLSEKLFNFNPVTQATDYMMGLSADQRVKAELSMPAPEETAMHPAVLGGVKSVVMNVPALAAGVAARSPTVALNAMMGNVYGDSYLTAKQSGLSEAESIIYSSNQAIAERAMEGISMFKLFEDMKLGTGFVKTIATQMALEIPTEQVTTIWQDAIDWAVLNPDKTVNEFMAERPDAAVNTLISTVVATGIQGSAMHGIGRLGRERDSDQLQAMADQANASLLNQRAPDIFAEFIQRASEEGGAPENVYIDAKEARALMQSMSQDRAYNLISEQVADAEAVGGDIVIPVGEFASTVATSNNFEILKNSLRLSPEQLTESQREGQPERIASMLLEANKNVELKARAVQIHNEITQQLIDTGRMNRDTAKASSSIIPAYVVSMSSRSGLSVDEVYGMMGLSIKGADSSSSSTSLEQKSLAEWDAMLRELDYSESKATQSKNDETEFLSNAPAGTRHTDESPLLKRIRRSSDQAYNELGGSPEAGRVGKTRLGQFTEYRTQADIIEPDSIHPDGRLEVHVFGKEQDQQNLSEEPALTFVVSKNGELSVNGPTGETFQKFKEAGWAQDATGKGGEVQDGWTALTTKNGKPIPLSELSPLIADVHARVRAWRGEDKVGLHWSRSTGATGEVSGGRKTAVFFQHGDESQGENRGSFDPKSGILRLTQASDASTFFHEAGHLFLEMEAKLFNHPNATEQMKADGQVILDWLGIPSFESLQDYETNPVSREAHEKFARGFELYIAEGKAPSIELKVAFRRFAAWMKQVYRDLININVELNDDVRAVMDRMLATDEQIARVANDFKPLFESAEDAGMTQAEFNAYTIESSPESAKEDLMKKMMAQLKREYTKWWKDEALVVAGKIRKELIKTPLYSALSSIQSEETKINKSAAESHFDGVIPKKFSRLISENGITADEMAAMHGLASGSELLDLINISPSFNAKVKELTALEMQQKHGDILTDGTIREEAEKAVRGAAHAKMLIAELSALSRKTKTPAIDREAMKQYAKEVIGKMAFSKIRPAQYRSAEIRAARDAATLKAKGDLVGAQKAKTQELINFYLSREATATKEKADANRKYMQAILVRKYNTNEVNPDYVTQMQALARLYDFRKNPQSQDSARIVLRSIGEWITAQSLVEESGYYPTVIDPILSLVNAAKINDKLGTIEIPSYRDMTAEEIQGVADQAKNLRYIGGLLSENAKNVLKLESERVGESIRENGKGLAAAIPEEITRRDQRMSALREFGQDHIRLANQIEEMDGFKKFGPLFESLYQDIIDSTNKELKLKRHAFDNLRAALSGLKVTDLGQGKDEKTIMRESGETLTLSRRARIVFGLYWGSPEGREAIKLGHNMTDNDAQKMLDLLEDKDLDAIEGIWKTNEVHWPEVSRINQKLKGVTLPKVEHISYESNGRKLPGGYLRLFYKYDKRDSVRDIKAEDLLMTRTGNRLARNTKNGSRNERVGSGGRKVSWDFNNVFVALDETIHDIAFAETASKASRFIRSNAVLSAISDVYGKEKYESILSSLSGIIAGNTSISHPISGFLQHFRVAQTYAFLGYSIRNLVQQPLAYFNVFGKAVTSFDGYGEVKVMAEVAKFAMSPKETIEFVRSKSEFIINRTSVVNAETAAVRQRFSYGTMAGGWWETYKNHAFATQTLGDMIVVYPAWMAAYNEGLKKYADEKKAVTFADEFVSSTVGSGLIKDMAPLLQGGGKVGQAIGSEQLKAITFMGSFFNVNLNLMTESFKRSEYLTIMGRKTVPSSADFYRQMMWYVTVPAIIGALIVGNGPDEEDENFFGWAAKEMAAYSLSSIFFIRDIVSMARGFGPSSSYSRAAEAAKKLAEEGYKIYEDEKDVDAKTAGKILRASGMLFPIPGSGSGARALEEVGSDEEFNPYKALVTGANK